jgi:hypothetical protein|tara:strand:+ start:405 stop:1544 length:1140 start_codon:yes stop_codon:yes gene_type:complete
MAGIQIDGVNNKIDFDDDADTSISSATDDTLVVEVGGNTLATVTATSLTINDGVTITTADNTDTLTLKSTDADAVEGPNLILQRDSGSPADGDDIARIDFDADNDAGEVTRFITLRGNISDASDGSEDAQFLIQQMIAGTNVNTIRVKPDEIVLNDSSIDLDFRVESNNLDDAFFVNGENGYVNIGTTAGLVELNVHDSANAQSYVRFTHSTSGETTDDGYLVGLSGVNALIINYEAGAQIFYTNALERFRIASNGDLTATDTSISSNSDLRLKENIADYTYDINKFKQFQAKTFDWKNPEEHNSKTNNRGFIAQEVAAIDDYWTDQIPIDSNKEDAKLIDADSDGNHMAKTLKLGKKDAMYISVIQQLITRIEALEGN